jgi:flagellar basal-body rod protein FlgB
MEDGMPDGTLKILEHMLDVSAFRHKVLTSNIANADTPGYKAKDIAFQKELDNAVATDGKGGYEIYESGTTMPNRDGNTVNLDMEMAKVAENTLIYNTAVEVMSMKIRMTKDALTK